MVCRILMALQQRSGFSVEDVSGKLVNHFISDTWSTRVHTTVYSQNLRFSPLLP